MRTLFLLLQLLTSARANTPTPTPLPTVSNLMQFSKQAPGADEPTYQILNDQERSQASRTSSLFNASANIVTGHQRAQEMVELLKNQQLQKAFAPLNDRGKQMLEENPDLKNPVAIIAGATALWIGRTVKLIKGDDFKLNTRVEARARSGEFSMESPIFNGKLTYTGNDGISMNLNRTISSIDARAEMNYSQHDQTISGQLVHPLTPHLDLSFGAAQYQQTNQTDSRATLQYNLSF